MAFPTPVNSQITDAASPPTTVNPQITDAASGSFDATMERTVAAALGLAMHNAVSASQALYVVGESLLRENLARGAEAAVTTASPAAEASQAHPAAEAPVVATPSAQAGAPCDGPALALRWSTAFAESLALINAAVTQEMTNVARVVLQARVKIAPPLDPADAMILEGVLQGNAVAETLATLQAAAAARQIT